MTRKIMKWTALMPLAGAASALFAQDTKPEKETVTGSLIPHTVEYEKMAMDRGRRAMARFATCVYKRNPKLVIRLLDSSDPMSIDFPAAGLTETNFQAKLGLESCLVDQAEADRIQMRVKPGVLHEMLTEPAYLAANPEPPTWLSTPFSSPARRFFATGTQLTLAQGLAQIADCMVTAAPIQSDALLRTKVASNEERTAAIALAPVLGGCLYQGQSLTLTPASIRGWAASGLWQAERSRAFSGENTN